MISRRQFLTRTAGSVAAAQAFGSLMMRDLEARARALAPLGLPIGGQVYPHRQRIQDGDFAGLMKDMKALGIGNVELDSPAYAFAKSLADGKQTRKILDDNGLKCPSIHFTMPELRTKLQEAIGWAKDVGADQVSTASLNGKSTNGTTTLDEVKRAADEFNNIAAAVAKAGMITTLHNEGFEHAKVEDGRLVFHVLFDLLDPKTVFRQYQMSSARITADGNPVALFTTHPNRFRSLHLQGMPAAQANAAATQAGGRSGAEGGGRAAAAAQGGQDAAQGAGRAGRGGGGGVAVGSPGDTFDWPKIFPAAKIGGITNYFIEQPWDLLVQGAAYLKTLNV